MANVTDPLAAAVHGTDPQNMLEYIVRQKIYDSRFWKEECFGLSAADVLEKAATTLKCIGGSYGGNAQPTRFLSLALKLLQIQPSTEVILDTFLETEDFKYVRALGAFYLRLTGRPTDIYKHLEPLYRDYRRIRYRAPVEWQLLTMDHFIHSLLTESVVCGIALPRLVGRSILVEEGYLEDDYTSPLGAVVKEKSLEEYLFQKVQDGSSAAERLWNERQQQKKQKLQEENHRLEALQSIHPCSNDEAVGVKNDDNDISPSNYSEELSRSSRKKQKKDRNYGSLFKNPTTSSTKEAKVTSSDLPADSAKVDENSEEYW
eukprot:CAMPEP_0194256750 /NCGR_PEP_ID=MMETSP0158-20130606/37462_1 /TAXON_ID=33649 /ORGANISM="Thalassionema nitzschioides, Strain L26-B" /LENGTH=316 /DNA_ID=CAMNT_0038995565 /DNA_START=27 /DNA_END=974 /DNA_ORIENTATION=-